MEIVSIILLFVIIALLFVIFIKLCKMSYMMNIIRAMHVDTDLDIKTIKKHIEDLDATTINISNSIKGLITPIKTVAQDISKVRDIADVVYKLQSIATINKNMVEEIRNTQKASKARKTNKVNKTSSNEKSLNTEAHKGSQSINSSNKDNAKN